MSTNHSPVEGHRKTMLTTYYGGPEAGRSLQLTQRAEDPMQKDMFNYIKLSTGDVEALVVKLSAFLREELLPEYLDI